MRPGKYQRARVSRHTKADYSGSVPGESDPESSGAPLAIHSNVDSSPYDGRRDNRD